MADGPALAEVGDVWRDVPYLVALCADCGAGVIMAPILPLSVPSQSGPNASRDEELDQGAAILLIVEMVERWGISTVHRWIRNIANAQGQDVCR